MKRLIGIAIIFIILGALISLTNIRKGENIKSSALVKEQQEQNSIAIKNYDFQPMSISVKKGTTIVWTNGDIARHNIIFDAASPVANASPLFGKNQHFSYTFTKAGTYHYHCELHPYMKAIVEVTP